VSRAVLVPLAEYLGQTYHPDCDYLEGRLLERYGGELDHGDAQTAVVVFVRTRATDFWAVVEVRVQVKPERFRVPDVLIVRGGKPKGRIVSAPPEIVVEVLSPDDRATDVLEKIADYLAFGVPCVWVLDPESKRAYVHTEDGAREVKDGVLRNAAGDLAIPLSAIFPI
jgi:Uma2 family endonuclease